MKRILSLIICLMAFNAGAMAEDVTVSLSGSGSAALVKKLEKNAMSLLNEINRAYRTGDDALIIGKLDMTETSMNSIANLWTVNRFYCDDSYIEQNINQTLDGYSVRGIPLISKFKGDDDSKAKFQEAVIYFNKDGQLDGFYFSMGEHNYNSIMKKGNSVTDIRRKQEIIRFTEMFRTYYNEKNIEALRNVFSPNALIITGSVVTKGDVTVVNFSEQSVQSYLKRLETVFKINKEIYVNFFDVEEPKEDPQRKNRYGIRLKQEWTSSTYSDVGYLYLVWEFFEDGRDPIIHVRAWQPYWQNEKEKIPMPEELLYDISRLKFID